MPRKQKKNNIGRPREFKEKYIQGAREGFGQGLTDVKFCKIIGISRDSLNRWRKEYPEFEKAVQEGKDDYDSNRIEKSLQKRANGYSFTETTRELEKIGIDETGKEKFKYCITKKISKHVSPDTAAICFWLKNRRRDRWRDIKAVEASGPDGGAIPIDLQGLLKGLTTDELRILKNITLKAATAGNS